MMVKCTIKNEIDLVLIAACPNLQARSPSLTKPEWSSHDDRELKCDLACILWWTYQIYYL